MRLLIATAAFTWGLVLGAQAPDATAQTPGPHYPNVVQVTAPVHLPDQATDIPDQRTIQRITVDGMPCVLYDTGWQGFESAGIGGAISCDWADR